MTPLARKLLEMSDKGQARLAYGIVSGNGLTVLLEGASTAVTIPRLESAGPLIDDDFVAVLVAGADSLIVGKVGGSPTRGVALGTTDGSGDLSITHGLGATPSVVSVTSSGSAAPSWYVRARDSTQFKVRCYSAAGTLQTSTLVSFDWVAYP